MGFGATSCQVKSYGTQNLDCFLKLQVVKSDSQIQDECLSVDIGCLLTPGHSKWKRCFIYYNWLIFP